MELMYLRTEVEAQGRTFVAGTAAYVHETRGDDALVALPDAEYGDAHTFEAELPRDVLEPSGARFDRQGRYQASQKLVKPPDSPYTARAARFLADLAWPPLLRGPCCFKMRRHGADGSVS